MNSSCRGNCSSGNITLSVDSSVRMFVEINAWEAKLYITLLAIIFLTGVPLNSILIGVLHRHQRLRCSHSRMLLSLTVADLVNSAFGTTATAAIYVWFLQGRYSSILCYFRRFFTEIWIFSNMIFLSLMNLEKYYSFSRPFEPSLIHPALVPGAWVATFLVLVGISLEFWLSNDERCFIKYGGESPLFYYVMTLVVGVVMIAVSFISYWKVIRSMRDQDRLLEAHSMNRQRLDKLPIRLAAVFFFVFVFLWMPSAIVRVLKLIFKVYYRTAEDEGKNENLLIHIYCFTGVLMMMSSVIHPLSVLFMSKQVRLQAVRFVRNVRDRASVYMSTEGVYKVNTELVNKKISQSKDHSSQDVI